MLYYPRVVTARAVTPNGRTHGRTDGTDNKTCIYPCINLYIGLRLFGDHRFDYLLIDQVFVRNCVRARAFSVFDTRYGLF